MLLEVAQQGATDNEATGGKQIMGSSHTNESDTTPTAATVEPSDAMATTTTTTTDIVTSAEAAALTNGTRVSRRSFVGMLGAMGIGVAGMSLYACSSNDDVSDQAFVPVPTHTPVPPTATAQAPQATAATDHTDHGATGTQVAAGATGTGTETASGEPAWVEMDRMHEAGVKSFPVPTKGVGGQPLEYTLDGDVKVFELTCSMMEWEYDAGKSVEVMCYNEMVPGPEIRVTEGDKVRFIVTNTMEESTAIHWHGLILPNAMDGVPFITQPPITPGSTFTYEWTVRKGNIGSHMYHSHLNAAEQVTRGLLGAFIVEPQDPADWPEFDREYTLILNDGPIGGFTINGKSFPATAPVSAKLGEKVLIRYMNEGLMIHPMHLHGMPQLVVAQDGWALPQPYMCDTLNIAPGQRFDVLIEATELGVWAFHCHILSHAESSHGMFGMVTVFIVEE